MTEIFSFGEWVRRRRKALDLTQDALARQVGCALSMIRKIEADERRPSRQIAELLADALAVPETEREQFLRTARAELAPDQLAPPVEHVPLPLLGAVPATPIASALPIADLKSNIHGQPSPTGLPTGTVTFVFTDLVGSTRLWEQYPQAMPAALAHHDAILHASISAQSGIVVKTTGDGVHAAFARATDALTAAYTAQQTLIHQSWGEVGSLRVRMVVHSGVTDERAGDYYGPVLNRAARLLALAQGGQVLLSRAAQALVTDHLPPGLTLRDLGEHPLRDLSRPEQIFQLIAPGLPTDVPPLATAAPSSNLPTTLPPLIGRDPELAELAGLLHDPEVRLVTLTGPGGTGKTSLALRLSTRLRDTQLDGIWFVDLAPISDPLRVAPTIVQALGLPESSASETTDPATVWARLARWLAPQRILLVLDNFEQVIDAAASLAQLLERTPHLQLVVTSRIALRITNEREYPVAPLRVPAPMATQAAQIADSPAVQLFVARAQAARPGFVLADAQAAAVSAICTTLDGLPLAIELAAARVRIFSPAELLSRLTRAGGLALLTTGARDRPARQQTIRAAIAWSYDLLGPLEQRLFRRLGMFVGGWTLALAEVVCDLDGSVIDSLQLLIEHSLAQRSAAAEPATFHMLETVREFAFEQLVASGEEIALRHQHLAACVIFAEQAEPHLRSATQLEWLPQIDQMYDNLRTALVWGLDNAENDPARLTLGLRLAGALWYYWYIRGRFQEAFRWLEHAATADERLPVALRAHVLLSHWFIVSMAESHAPLSPSGQQGLALAQRVDNSQLLARALVGARNVRDQAQGWVLSSTGIDPWWFTFLSLRHSFLTPTESDVREALAHARRSGDRMLICWALVNAGMYHLIEDHLTQVQALGEEALTIARELDHKFGIAQILFFLSRGYEGQGNVSAARECGQERYNMEHLVENVAGSTASLLDQARMVIWQAEYRYAAELLSTIEHEATVLGPWWCSITAWSRSWLVLEQGDGTVALFHAQKAFEWGQALGHKIGMERLFNANVIAVRWLLGTIAVAQQDFAQATERYTESFHQLQELSQDELKQIAFDLPWAALGFTGPTIVALSGLGRIAAYHPDHDWARQWLTDTLATIREKTGIWESTIAHAVWGRAYLGWDEYAAAAAQFSDDLRFYHKAGARRAIAEALEGLAACAGAQGQWDAAVRWWAAADRLRAEIGAPLWPVDQTDRDHRMMQARVQLSRESFDTTWATGQSLTREQAIAEALAFTDRPAS